MDRIVVPIDFSKTARGALLYAAHLAKEWDARLEVVHIGSGALNLNESPSKVSTGQEQKTSLQQWMQDFLHEAALPPGVNVSTHVEQGVTEKRLVEYSADGVDLMVMGATGKNPMGKRFFGSVSEAVARRSHCPVLLIPAGATYHPVQSLLFGSDFSNMEENVLRNLWKLATLLKAEVHFVYVETHEEDRYPGIENRLLTNVNKDRSEDISYRISSLRAQSVDEGLNRYLENHACDWVIMVARKPLSLWHQLFHRSQTKAMILHAKKPLMVFHLGD